ncbi:MAG: hypothetical protein WC683_10365 [bacterium]
MSSIGRCELGHWFIGAVCSICLSPAVGVVESRPGDCIDCGCLCPEYAYGCTQPHPIVDDEVACTNHDDLGSGNARHP